jgi:transposase-like protein
VNQERNGHRREGVSTADREQWVRRYREGDLGLKHFAERHGLRPAQLHYWIYGARRPAAPERTPTSAAVPTAVFREVLLPRLSSAEWVAQITWPDGLSLRIAREADPARIGTLIEHLRRACSR